jgi:hypothetical protein
MATKYSRHCERVPFFCKAALAVLPVDNPVEAHTFDISLGGVGLYAQVSCPRGSMVRVSFLLKGPKGEAIEPVVGRVAYLKADESGTRIGIEFQESIEQSTHPELTRRLQSL